MGEPVQAVWFVIPDMAPITPSTQENDIQPPEIIERRLACAIIIRLVMPRSCAILTAIVSKPSAIPLDSRGNV